MQRPVNPRAEKVNEKITEIIVRMNKDQVYVSREAVQKELFDFYRAQTWRDMGAHPRDLDTLYLLTEREKSVTFYLEVLEQVFNLCTLHEVENYLLKFMKVQHYEDLRLGPLYKNPRIQRMFDYAPQNKDDDSVPPITNGMVIKGFLDFRKNYKGPQEDVYRSFLDQLVRDQQVQGVKNLGVFCRSAKYLIQVGCGKFIQKTLNLDLGFKSGGRTISI